MVTRERVESGHTLRFTVTRGPVGWDVREERDSRIVREANYTDWHRVERAIQVFERVDRPVPADAAK
jgi:hypothetical protein